MKKTLNLLLCSSLLLIILAGCAPAASPAAGLTPVTVQLKWLHQAQFAGFYAADLKGYYAEEGLKVNFMPGGSGVDVMAPLLDGTAQFGITEPANLMVSRAKDMPFQAIAGIYRRSPLVFLSKSELGITRPEDIAGKTVRLTLDIEPVFHSLMNRVGISPDAYNEVDVPSTLDTFASDQAQVWGVYLNGFAITATQAGYALNKIFPDDYGIHFASDTLFTTDDLISRDPDLVLRFLRATLKGWTYTVENPGEVGNMVLTYNSQADVALENEKMLASLPLINTGEDHIGWMKAETWQGMQLTLLEQGVLTAPLDISQVYTMQFLEEIYK